MNIRWLTGRQMPLVLNMVGRIRVVSLSLFLQSGPVRRCFCFYLSSERVGGEGGKELKVRSRAAGCLAGVPRDRSVSARLSPCTVCSQLWGVKWCWQWRYVIMQQLAREALPCPPRTAFYVQNNFFWPGNARIRWLSLLGRWLKHFWNRWTCLEDCRGETPSIFHFPGWSPVSVE